MGCQPRNTPLRKSFEGSLIPEIEPTAVNPVGVASSPQGPAAVLVSSMDESQYTAPVTERKVTTSLPC